MVIMLMLAFGIVIMLVVVTPPPKTKPAPTPPVPPPEDDEDDLKPGQAGRVHAAKTLSDGSSRSWVIFTEDGEQYDMLLDTPEPLPTHFVRGADGKYLSLGDEPIDLEVADQPLRPGTSTFGGMTPSPQASRPCTTT